MKKYISKLDSARFGFKVAKLQEWEENPEDLVQLLKKNQVKLVITRLPCEQINTINKLETLGFRIKDTQVTYQYELKNLDFDYFEIPYSWEVREAEEQDLPSLKNIARNSFKEYGHYFANDRLDIQKTQEIYEDWALRSFNDSQVADKIFVAMSDSNEVAGFITYKIFDKEPFTFAACGLVAVSEHYRNRGVFKLLLKKGLLWGKTINLDWVEHNCLSTNYPASKSKSQTGFHVSASFVTLHGWLD